MSGHGEKLSRKQEQAIAALLAETNVERAALATGVAASTLRRWLQQPGFSAAFRTAREQRLAATIDQLVDASADAVALLKDALHSDVLPFSQRMAAARCVLDFALKGAALRGGNRGAGADLDQLGGKLSMVDVVLEVEAEERKEREAAENAARITIGGT